MCRIDTRMYSCHNPYSSRWQHTLTVITVLLRRRTSAARRRGSEQTSPSSSASATVLMAFESRTTSLFKLITSLHSSPGLVRLLHLEKATRGQMVLGVRILGVSSEMSAPHSRAAWAGERFARVSTGALPCLENCKSLHCFRRVC